ncbi:RusA family crossover junction endodeoxyribonuclease [Myxosarcina sp. GI1]|uniref:RusA family crossover junction endodeoxyribonuclease n=1 Tax=Myxosarcina sp. GI1 TaxID=1541065 RepID=UPI000690D001|nr:RusA family crossover junction endodeoxyribonuclease [Myxosarcina sp. GI1]
MTTKTSHHFTLTGAVVPKARPRVTRQGTFLPQKYRDWKEGAIAELLSQRTRYKSLEEVTISIKLYGTCRGDLDNIAGAILDALVQAGIIKDDRVSLVKALSVKHCGGKIQKVDINIEEV